MMFAKFQGFTNGDAQMWLAHLEFLASPGTISPVTYDVRTLNDNGDFFALNRTVSDANTTGNARGVSSITAIEVAA
jgi:CRISPR/Cas system type I-B associated protein Csh2 (Cas7 group RAMP superfamily)